MNICSSNVLQALHWSFNMLENLQRSSGLLTFCIFQYFLVMGRQNIFLNHFNTYLHPKSEKQCQFSHNLSVFACYTGRTFVTTQVHRCWTNHCEILLFDRVNTVMAMRFTNYDIWNHLMILLWNICSVYVIYPAGSVDLPVQFPVDLIQVPTISSIFSCSIFLLPYPPILTSTGTVNPFSESLLFPAWTTSLRSMAYAWLHCSLSKPLLMFFVDYYSPCLHIKELCFMFSSRSFSKIPQITSSVHILQMREFGSMLWGNSACSIELKHKSVRWLFFFG